MASAKLASAVAKIEGQKKQVDIGNVRETLKALETVIAHSAFAASEEHVTNAHYAGEILNSAQKQLDKMWRKAKKTAR